MVLSTNISTFQDFVTTKNRGTDMKEIQGLDIQKVFTASNLS